MGQKILEWRRTRGILVINKRRNYELTEIRSRLWLKIFGINQFHLVKVRRSYELFFLSLYTSYRSFHTFSWFFSIFGGKPTGWRFRIYHLPYSKITCLTSCAGMTCHARRKHFAQNCNIFSALIILKYNPDETNNYYFLVISIQRYTDEFRKKTNCCIRFGHSLWSVIQLLAQEVKGYRYFFRKFQTLVCTRKLLGFFYLILWNLYVKNEDSRTEEYYPFLFRLSCDFMKLKLKYLWLVN